MMDTLVIIFLMSICGNWELAVFYNEESNRVSFKTSFTQSDKIYLWHLADNNPKIHWELGDKENLYCS